MAHILKGPFIFKAVVLTFHIRKKSKQDIFITLKPFFLATEVMPAVLEQGSHFINNEYIQIIRNEESFLSKKNM